ncbi:LCP family protein [Streptomyces sp. A7024]|uniref:LCP family protein n=1 Tax=Streptomyces coryli TaxID=1128680 RepID=A0A6G4U275_9ACTN|nr:LCP family protein [Streptomyces coryli]NGN65387.1 LCP family protein [Streptomyces coryli]
MNRRRYRWPLLALAFLTLIAGGAGWYWYERLDGNIHADSATARELLRYEQERPQPSATGAQNILLIGSDSRTEARNRKYGQANGKRSDTTILLHIAGDRRSTTAVSIPRDLMTGIPSCRRPNGDSSGAQTNQFNFAFSYGGASCTIRTVERLTGLRVDHHMIVDFAGFKDMVNAVNGVEVCVPEAINDKPAKLHLKAGRQTLMGEEALGYVRARKSLGDGSDTDRMARQQEFLASLVSKVKSNGVLLNPLRLAPLLDAATKSVTTDPGLASLTDMYDLVRSLRDVPEADVRFLTVPRQPYRYDTNRDELVQPDAEELFDALRLDTEVPFVSRQVSPVLLGGSRPAQGEDPGADTDPDGGSPAFEGTRPTDDICK